MARVAQIIIVSALFGASWSGVDAVPALGMTTFAVADRADSLTIQTHSDRFEFHIELADTPEERQRGLMYRRTLADDHGMLFDFTPSRPVIMWMRNTYVPLDMVFIDSEGQIVKIVPNTVPLSETVIPSDGPVRAVLELHGGITQQLGIEPGDRVLHPLFSPP